MSRTREEFRCTLTQLAVTWYAAPQELTSPLAGAPQDSEDPDQDDTSAEEGTIVDDLSPEPDPPKVDPTLDAWLKASESLLIRLAMPMLNEKQD